MIEYDPWYDYGLALDYNKKGKYLKGSAIFLHCEGKAGNILMDVSQFRRLR